MGTIADNNEILQELIDRYSLSPTPIEVNFRKLVSSIPYNSERSTHLIHPYPAKLLLHIPYFFLNNEILSSEGDVVFDPFSGSGTVLLESLLSNRSAYGMDTNPLARLISKVKTTPIHTKKLSYETRKLFASIGKKTAAFEPDVVNIEHWFYPHVRRQLSRIYAAIETVADNEAKDFFSVCFSNCVRRTSLADLRVSVPVKLNPDCYAKGHWLREAATKRINWLRRVNVVKEFENIVRANESRMSDFVEPTRDQLARIIGNDARDPAEYIGINAKNHSMKRPSLIITSPPYAGAQKYIRASSLSLGWLHLCPRSGLRQHEETTVGREHYHKSEFSEPKETGIKKADALLKVIREKNPLRAHIAANYLCEMQTCFHNSISVLRPGGHFILVAANNRVCGHDFKTKNYLREILENQGLTLRLELVDDIQSRGLMTKRNKTASIISRESVLVFKKSKH